MVTPSRRSTRPVIQALILPLPPELNRAAFAAGGGTQAPGLPAWMHHFFGELGSAMEHRKCVRKESVQTLTICARDLSWWRQTPELVWEITRIHFSHLLTLLVLSPLLLPGSCLSLPASLRQLKLRERFRSSGPKRTQPCDPCPGSAEGPASCWGYGVRCGVTAVGTARLRVERFQVQSMLAQS